MRTDHFLAISLSVIVAVALCADSGCKKRDATGDTPPVAADEAKPTPPVAPVAQREETVQAPVNVKPAPDPNTLLKDTHFPH